ncbi:hypothetical protein [Microbacterium testaceum]|uniref:hypothetical protein n=1 Tax=Microbacterium testaceum TaxID=2033 RepID=UPI002435EB00|nr:hypothetical protein [Microbacterium testaceum]
MASKTRNRVTATMIVVKVPGAQGGETYLNKGRFLPESVTAKEVKRLKDLGLIETVTAEGSTSAPGDEPYKGVTVPDLTTEIEKRNEGRDDDKKIAPSGTKREDLVAALVADDAVNA